MTIVQLIEKDWMGTYHKVNGVRHRVNGPAAVWNDGDWFWYMNGVEHRYYGPQSNWGRQFWIVHNTRIKSLRDTT